MTREYEIPIEEWRDCKTYVLHTLESLQEEQKSLSKQMTSLTVESAVLKTKVIAWGSVASIIGAVIGSIVVGLVMHYLGLR
jgi:hypothetical protein